MYIVRVRVLLRYLSSMHYNLQRSSYKLYPDYVLAEYMVNSFRLKDEYVCFFHVLSVRIHQDALKTLN